MIYRTNAAVITLALLTVLLNSGLAHAGVESDTTRGELHLRLRANRYSARSTRFKDTNADVSIGNLHLRSFELRKGQTLTVFIDDPNPLLFTYPLETCTLEKKTTANAQLIQSFDALATGKDSGAEASSDEATGEVDSVDRSAQRAVAGSCSGKRNEDRFKEVADPCVVSGGVALDGQQLLEAVAQRVGKDGKPIGMDGTDGARARLAGVGIDDPKQFLTSLQSLEQQLSSRSACLPHLREETAYNLACVRLAVSQWSPNDSTALRKKAAAARGVASAALALVPVGTPDKGELGVLRDARESLSDRAGEVADFIDALDTVGRPRKVATFSYDSSENQFCTLQIKPLPTTSDIAKSYYWYGTTRVGVAPYTSYSLGLGATLLYSFVKRPEITTKPDGDKFRIVQTDASDYAGRGLAASLTLTPKRWQDSDFTPSFEFAVNPKDDLGLYVGAGFKLGQFFTVGGGLAFEQVKALSGGQKNGDLLPTADGLKTDKRFHRGLYLHLTVGSDFDFLKQH